MSEKSQQNLCRLLEILEDKSGPVFLISLCFKISKSETPYQVFKLRYHIIKENILFRVLSFLMKDIMSSPWNEGGYYSIAIIRLVWKDHGSQDWKWWKIIQDSQV